MDITTAKKIIELSLKTGDAILMEGLHGIGKSDIAKQIAKENGFHIEILFLSHQETADLIGIPHIVEKDGKQLTMWSMPDWLQRMYNASAQGKRCILFLDELNRAQIDVRQSALQLVLEGQIHEHKLPITNGEKTFIISAINPADDYQVDELDPALLDRFLTIKVEADSVSWLKWANENNIHKTIKMFISKNPDKLHYIPNEGKGSTPRAYAKLSDFLNLSDNIDEDILLHICKGKIGIDMAIQFVNFYKENVKFISVEDIEDFISKQNKTLSVEELGNLIKTFVVDVEVIRKKEIAEQMLNKYSDDFTNLLAFLYSLEIETMHSTLLDFKETNKEKYQIIADLDDKLNKKGLFMKIFNKLK